MEICDPSPSLTEMLNGQNPFRGAPIKQGVALTIGAAENAPTGIYDVDVGAAQAGATVCGSIGVVPAGAQIPARAGVVVHPVVAHPPGDGQGISRANLGSAPAVCAGTNLEGRIVPGTPLVPAPAFVLYRQGDEVGYIDLSVDEFAFSPGCRLVWVHYPGTFITAIYELDEQGQPLKKTVTIAGPSTRCWFTPGDSLVAVETPDPGRPGGQHVNLFDARTGSTPRGAKAPLAIGGEVTAVHVANPVETQFGWRQTMTVTAQVPGQQPQVNTWDLELD